MQPGTRVKLTDRFVHGSTNPERHGAYRGVVMSPTPHTTQLGPTFTYVWWDGGVEPYPVRTEFLTIEDDPR